MSNRRCMVPQPNKTNPAEPGFEIVEAAIPDKLENDHVLLKVLVSPRSRLDGCSRFVCFRGHIFEGRLGHKQLAVSRCSVCCYLKIIIQNTPRPSVVRHIRTTNNTRQTVVCVVLAASSAHGNEPGMVTFSW